MGVERGMEKVEGKGVGTGSEVKSRALLQTYFYAVYFLFSCYLACLATTQ